MVNKIILPTRNVVAVVSHQDQRMIKWFEDASTSINDLNTSIGSGGILDMGDRISGTSLYDGGSRV